MRIIGGQMKGRTLSAPKGLDVRPTTDRVRETLFNIVEHQLGCHGKRVLDLFAGSGALGFEALSRGAVFAVFVEDDSTARGAIQTNAEQLGMFGKCKVYRRDASDLGTMLDGKGGPFDLVFLDPPYDKGLGPIAMASALKGGWLSDDALIVLETRRTEDPTCPGFEKTDRRQAGDTALHFFRIAKA